MATKEMPGTSPGMTRKGTIQERSNLSIRTLIVPNFLQQINSNSGHLLNGILDNSIPFNAGLEADRDVLHGTIVLYIPEEFGIGFEVVGPDTGLAIERPPQRRDPDFAPYPEIDPEPSL